MTESEYDNIAEFMYRFVDKEEKESVKLPQPSMVRSEQEIRFAMRFPKNTPQLDANTLKWVLYEDGGK